MNTPNKLTILRTCLIPVFIVVYLIPAIPFNNYIAAFIFIAAAITDFFDGFLARKYNLVTNFGKFLDPLADKLLVNLALLCFLIVPDNPVPAWVVFVIIARDFIINGFRLVASDNGVIIAADYWGKVKTAVQMVMVALVILNIDNDVVYIITLVLIYASAVLTVVSLIDCIVTNRHVLTGKAAKGSKDEHLLVEILKKKKMTIACAESCTGGLLSATIINVPGSSEVIRQSAVTYCNDAKMDILNVSRQTIDSFTEVSDETACEMAIGICEWAGSDIGVSVTGIAGPDGGTKEKPVGLVYIGIHYNNDTKSYKYVFKGNRKTVRTQAVNEAIKLAIDTINS